MRNATRFLAILPALFLVGGARPGADRVQSAVAIEGAIRLPQSWSTAQMKSAFAKDVWTIKYALKKDNHVATAVPLLSLLTAAGLKLDPRIKNQALRFVVVVEGRDGYTAAFAYGELMPEIGNQKVWVGLDMDGHDLSDRDSPANLIVPGDVKPGRWVHAIKSIRVVDTELIPPGK